MPKVVDPDENRRMIAEAACRAIARKGVQSATMMDIAHEAGVTTGMIANYFRNKDAIVAAALRVPFENVEARISARMKSGSNDLAEILDAAIPTTDEYMLDTAVWVSFWGHIATNRKFRTLNAKLHEEGFALFGDAVRRAWPESGDWPSDVFDQTLRSIVTFLFGLSTGGVTNPAAWTITIQRAQLRAHLTITRQWANAEADRPS